MNAELDQLREKFEELKLPSATIDELLLTIGGNKSADGIFIDKIADNNLLVNQIRAQLLLETDWKKRASLNAQLISLGLE